MQSSPELICLLNTASRRAWRARQSANSFYQCTCQSQIFLCVYRRWKGSTSLYIYIYIYILCTADAKVLPEGQNLFSPPLPSQLSSLLASVRSAIFIVPESLADVLESGLAKKLISSCLHDICTQLFFRCPLVLTRTDNGKIL